MEPYDSDLEFLLFCTAAALGSIVALSSYLLLRKRATGSFEQRVKIDQGTGQGPYRQGAGWFERVVSIDAPVALRVIVALTISTALADTLARIALMGWRARAIEASMSFAYRAELDATAAGAELFSWWAMRFPAEKTALLQWAFATSAPIVANVASVFCAIALLRAKRVGSVVAHGTLLVSLLSRGLELRYFNVYAVRVEQLPRGSIAPNTGSLIMFPVAVLVSIMLWRAIRSLGKQSPTDGR